MSELRSIILPLVFVVILNTLFPFNIKRGRRK